MIENKENEEYNETIDIIVRQTELSRDEAIVLLDKNQNNYMKALEEHFGIKPKTTSNNKTTVNQQIYKEIRSVMDDASFKFYNEREIQVKNE